MARTSFYSGTGVSTGNISDLQGILDDAAASQDAAATSAAESAASAVLSANSANAAQDAQAVVAAYQAAAEVAQAAAETAQSGAETAETNAETAQAAAEAAQAASEAARDGSSTYATNSANSASNAAFSAANAAADATDAVAALDEFTDLYLGAKASAPATDNDGDALQTGALYWNTSLSIMYIWDGSQWVQAYSAASGFLLASSNLSDIASAATARSNLGLAIGTNVQAYNANTVVDGSYVHTDNNYTTTEKNKLDGIEAGATADQTAAEILAAITTVDGSGSGLDADLLDGQNGSYYYSPANAPDPVITLTGAVTGSGTMTNLGNVSIATTATADPTLTINGDASGSATFTDLGNATLTLTVADDSHNHTISNVDGLQAALDDKLNLSGGTMTGVLDFTGDLGRAITITNDSTVDAADISIYLGNGSGLGFDILYEGTGAGNLNAFVIVSTNLGSPKELIRSNQNGIVDLPQLGATVAGNIIGHAGLEAGAVGTYAFARRPGSTGAQASFNWNTTYAGSTLRPAGLSTSAGTAESNPYWADTANVYIGQNNDGALSGTWRAVCQTDTTTTGDENPVGVFLRIS